MNLQTRVHTRNFNKRECQSSETLHKGPSHRFIQARERSIDKTHIFVLKFEEHAEFPEGPSTRHEAMEDIQQFL